MSPTHMASAEDAGDIFAPQPDVKIAHLAEIAALRQVTDTLGRMGKFMQAQGERMEKLTEKISEMHTDIALLRQSGERMDKMEKRHDTFEARLQTVELVHAGDAGARNGFKTIREWAPFILMLAVAVFTLIKTGAVHL